MGKGTNSNDEDTNDFDSEEVENTISPAEELSNITAFMDEFTAEFTAELEAEAANDEAEAFQNNSQAIDYFEDFDGVLKNQDPAERSRLSSLIGQWAENIALKADDAMNVNLDFVDEYNQIENHLTAQEQWEEKRRIKNELYTRANDKDSTNQSMNRSVDQVYNQEDDTAGTELDVTKPKTSRAELRRQKRKKRTGKSEEQRKATFQVALIAVQQEKRAQQEEKKREETILNQQAANSGQKRVIETRRAVFFRKVATNTRNFCNVYLAAADAVRDFEQNNSEFKTSE